MNDSRTKGYKPSYEGSFYKKIANPNEEDTEDTVKVKVEKMRQFSEHVKNSFVPEIDEKKRREMEEKR